MRWRSLGPSLGETRLRVGKDDVRRPRVEVVDAEAFEGGEELADLGPVGAEFLLAFLLGVSQDFFGKIGRAVDADFGEVDDVGGVGDDLHFNDQQVVVVAEQPWHPTVIDLFGEAVFGESKVRVALVKISWNPVEDFDGRAATRLPYFAVGSFAERSGGIDADAG